MGASRNVLRDLLLLSLLCLVAYTIGLTSVGLINTQETLRLNSAIEMQERGDWLVPTRRGEAYVRKPPMMYWIQIAMAEAMGRRVGLLHLRLTSALAGWLGVIATYLVARRILGPPERAEHAPEAAWWSALGLASGVLYFRSARSGEIDILLVPSVVVAVGAIHAAWRAHAEHARTSWGAIALASVATIAAALSKGPPPVILIALAGYGGILAQEARRLGADRRAAWGALAGAILLAGGSMVAPGGGGDPLGVAIFALLGGVIGWGLARLTRLERLVPALGALRRTHPEIVLLLALGALGLWGMLVGGRIGAEELGGSVALDLEDNLNVLSGRSPVRNLGFVAYGMLPMSVAAAGAGVWMARDRPVLRAGHLVLLAWLVLGFAEFSVLGKGVARYLTPLWPAVAMLGAWWFVTLLGELPPERARRLRLGAGALLLVLMAGQAAWYGFARDRFFGDRSPRDIAGALRALPGADFDRMGAYRIRTLAFEHYAGARIDRWEGAPDAELFSEMLARIRADDAPYLLLARRGEAGRAGRLGPLRDRLEEQGLRVEPIDVGARWVQPPDRTPVQVWRITSGDHR